MSESEDRARIALAYQVLTADLLMAMIQRNVLTPREGALFAGKAEGILRPEAGSSDLLIAAHQGMKDLLQKAQTARSGCELPRADTPFQSEQIPV